MSWADERARFPVLEQFAYFNAGTNGPLSRQTLDAMAELRSWEATHGRAGKAYFEAMIERMERVRALLAQQLTRADRECRADRVDDAGRARRRHRARARPVRRGRDDRRRAFRALRPAVRVGRVAPHCTRARRAGEGCLRARAPRGDAAYEADRALGCLVVRREGVPVAGAAGGDRGSDSRRRRSVRRCDRRRRDRGGLLHGERAEVALRAGFDGCALRARPRAAAAEARRLPGAGLVRHRCGDVGAEAGSGPLRHRFPSAVVARPGSRRRSPGYRRGASLAPPS